MVISPNSPWNNALSLIRANVSEQVYNTWFKKIGFESYDDKSKTVILQVPSHFVCEYLEENYVGLLGKALRQNFCPEVGLKYRLVAEKEVATRKWLKYLNTKDKKCERNQEQWIVSGLWK